MVHTFGMPVVWLLHAQEIRETADTISDASTRNATLEIAEGFEKMGREARARIMGSRKAAADFRLRKLLVEA
jgi:hypothetical protein